LQSQTIRAIANDKAQNPANRYHLGPTAHGTNANAAMIANQGQYLPGTDSRNPDSKSSTQNTIRDILEIRVCIYIGELIIYPERIPPK